MSITTPGDTGGNGSGAQHHKQKWDYSSGWGNPAAEVGHTGYDAYGWPIEGTHYQQERDHEAASSGGLFTPPAVGRPPGYHGPLPSANRGAPGASGGGNNNNGGGGHAPAGSGAGQQGGSAVVSQIVEFLRGKGLNDAVIAGILGNMRVETGSTPFSTTAYNPNENAIGLCQWEGDRRTALQQYASAHGMQETDLQAQLGYLWHELTTSESSVLSALQGVNSATTAANIWNRQYERSADYSNDRENYAAQFASQHLQGIHAVAGNPNGNYGAAGDVSLGGGSNAPGTTYNNTLQQAGLLGIIQAVPQLRGILQQAQAQGWSTERFLQAVEATPWYRNHGDSLKSLIALQAHDPAEYHLRIQNAEDAVRQQASQLGVDLNAGQIRTLAFRSLSEDWSPQTLQNAVGARFNPDGSPEGQAAAYSQQIHQIYAAQGLPLSDHTLNNYVSNLLAGKTTLDTYTQAALDAAKSMYPGLAHQLDSGMTVKDIADPYVQTMSNLLEINPQTIGIGNPLIKKALQGSIVQNGDKAQATTTPLWKFEQQVRSDPRWQNTNNAHQEVNGMLSYLGQSWGLTA